MTWQAHIAHDLTRDVTDVFIYRRYDDGIREFLEPHEDGALVRRLDRSDQPRPLLSLPWADARGVLEALFVASREGRMIGDREREIAARLHATEGARDTAIEFANKALAIVERKLMA